MNVGFKKETIAMVDTQGNLTGIKTNTVKIEGTTDIVLGGESQDVKYALISANGTIVQRGKTVFNDACIETSGLTAGVYILHLTSKSGGTKSFTLVRK